MPSRRVVNSHASSGNEVGPNLHLKSQFVRWRRGLLLLGVALGAFVVWFFLPTYSKKGRFSDDLPSVPVADDVKQVSSDWALPPRPGIEESVELTGELQEYRKTFDEVFDVAEKLVAEYPTDPSSLKVLADLHQRYRNEPVALELWKRCLELDPTYVGAYVSLANLATIKGDLDLAEEKLNSAIEVLPESLELLIQLSEVLAKQGKFEEVIKRLEPVQRIAPELAYPNLLLARAYGQLRDFESSLNYYQRYKAFSLSDDEAFESQLGVASALQQLGREEEARLQFEALERLRNQQKSNASPQSGDESKGVRNRLTLANAYISAGIVYAQHDNLTNAEKYWKKACRADPENLECRESLVELYMSQGRMMDAYLIGRELARLSPKVAKLWSSVGVLAVQLRRLDEAVELLRHAIALDPENAENFAVLAQVYMSREHDPGEAVKLARRAVELRPTAFNHYILGTAHWNNQGNEEARASLNRAVELDPNNAEYQQALAFLRQEN